jgi:hypothetical protein
MNLETEHPVRIKLLFVALVVIVAARATPADPLFFGNTSALQDNGATRVDLFSNPGTTLIGPQITFLVDITGNLNPGTTDTLLVSYSEAGGSPIVQSFQIPLFGTVQPPFTLVFSVTSLAASFAGTPATLTFDLLNSNPDFIIPGGPNAGQRVDSYTYSFNVSKPIPEPATLALLGFGLSGVLARSRLRRNSNK